MSLDKRRLLRVLRIGQDTSIQGEGLSLYNALVRCNYRCIRDQFTSKDLVPLLQTHPDLISEWIAYCEDKRTSGGYWVSDKCEVGAIDSPGSTVRYKSAAEAVAEFIVHELDYWSAVGNRRTKR